jgi:hypothetical protein
MAVSDNRRFRARSVAAAVLTLLLLVPVGILFRRVWDADRTDRDRTRHEQHGVQYLTRLGPLLSALAEAESTAMRGNTAAPDSLAAAVSAADAADRTYGDELGTHERWNGLQEKIGRLPGLTGDPLTVYQAHVEVGDLALALYNAVRNNSQLARDPDNDVSHLQEAVAVDLPGALVQASRTSDLGLMLAGAAGRNGRQRTQQAVLGPQLGAAVLSVNTSVNSLTDNLQAAVDDTRDATWSGELVNTLDAFRQGVEALTRDAGRATGAPDASTLATAQSQLRTSLGALDDTILREAASLLQARLHDLDSTRVQALAAAGAAALLALLALIVLLGGRRRATPPPGRPADERAGASEPGRGNTFSDLVPGYGDVPPARREPSGVVR